MFGKKSNDNGEKLYRYSIRKYHFGAASVAVAALMFFANGAVKADTLPVSPVTANTEKVNAGVTGLTEGVPPKEHSIEKSKEVEGDKTTVAQKTVDKSPLVQAISELQAAIAKVDEESLLSLSNQLSQLTDENKRLLDGEDISEEALTRQVIRVQSLTEQVRQLKSKTEDKTSNKEDRADSKAQKTKELKVSDKAVIPTNQTEEIKAVQKDDNKEEGAANKDKLESLSKSLITYLDAAKKIERPETKKLLEGVEEIVRSVENGLVNSQLTASEIEELMKQGKQAEKKLALAVARENSGKRDSRNGQRIGQGTGERAATVSSRWNTQDNLLIYQWFRATDGSGNRVNDNRQFTENKVDMTAQIQMIEGHKYLVYDVFFNNDGKSMVGLSKQQLYNVILPPKILDLQPNGLYKPDTIRALHFDMYRRINQNEGGTLSQNPDKFRYESTEHFHFINDRDQSKGRLTYLYNLGVRQNGSSYDQDMKEYFKNNKNDQFLKDAVALDGVNKQWAYGIGVRTNDATAAVHMHFEAKLRSDVTNETVQKAFTLAIAGTYGATTNQSYVFGSGKKDGEYVEPTVKQSVKYPISGREVIKTVGDSLGNVSDPVASGFVVRNNNTTSSLNDVRWSWTNGRQPNTSTAGIFTYSVTAHYYDNSSNSATVTLKVKPKTPEIDPSSVSEKAGKTGQNVVVNVKDGVPDNSTVTLYSRDEVIGRGTTTRGTATINVSRALPSTAIRAKTSVQSGNSSVESEFSAPVIPTEVPDRVAPTVSINGNGLSTNADENRFIIYRGANFNPTFGVQDDKNNVTLTITNLPKGVGDISKNGTKQFDYAIPENEVAIDAPLEERTASVVATDGHNSVTYQFKYRIVDIQAKNNATENRPLGSELGNPRNYFKVAESNTVDGDKYYPNDIQFKWKEVDLRNSRITDVLDNTKLNELGTITKYNPTAVFPNTVYTKRIDNVNYTIYSPASKIVPKTFNVTDNVVPTVKMTNPTNNTESVLGSDENNLPVVEVFRGATLNIPLKMFDNNTAGKINIKHISGLPAGVNLNNGNTLSQNSGSETNPATASITGRVDANAELGTKVVTLKVSDNATGDVNKGNQATLKFKVKTYDLAFEEKGTRVDDNTRSDVLGLNTQSLDPNHYLAITDGANVTNDWGSGMVFRYLKGNEIRETVSFDKIGKHSVKARAYFPTNKTSTQGLPTNPPGLTGDIASTNGRGFLEKTVEFNVKPNTPTISQPQFNGTAGTRPNVTVENLPTNAQLQNGANVTVELYQGTTKVASKTVTDRNGTTTLSTRDFTTNLTEGQQVHAVVKVSGGQGATAYSVSSDNSERRNVTGYNLVARDIINVKRGETISADELKRFIQVQEGNQRVDLPQGATVTATLDTNSIRSGSEETKTVEATVNFGENRTKKVSLTYKVLNIFPIANTIYDFKDVTRSNGHSDYYKNTGNNIPSGMSWVYKRSGGAEQVGTSFKTTLASDPVGTTSYEFIGKYNYGRFTNSPSESEKLVHKETLVHKVFDIADSKNVSVSQGTTLSVEQAKAAVKNATGSDTLPTGTTYQWVGNNVASTSGKQIFQVKVTLPVSQTGDNLPAATQATPSKTINVTVNVTPPKPTFDSNKVTSTSRTITGTLGGLNANSSNTVVSVALNDGTNRVLTSENNGGVRISGNTWTATLPDDVKLRTSVAKNGETTQPTGLTVTTKIKGSTTADDISVVGDVKAVEMGDYSVNATIAGSKHIDVKVPHDAKRMELRFHNSTETSNTPKSIVLVRSQNGGNWQVDSTATPAGVTDANNFVQAITNTVNASNKAENLVTITLKESHNNSKLRIKEENASGDNTATYRTGLGLRVDYKPETGQTVSPVGNWKVVNVTNNKPTLVYKGTEASSVDARKVFPSGTSITKAMLENLVTVGDTEDKVANEADKPYGTPTIKIVSGLTETPGIATVSGSYAVVLKAVDSQGKESDPLTVYVGVVSTDVKYQPKVGGEAKGQPKAITVPENKTRQGDVVNFTPEEITVDGKVYVPVSKDGHSVTLTDKPKTEDVEYVEKPASKEVSYQPKVGGEAKGGAKDITVPAEKTHQGDVVTYTPEDITVDGKVYTPARPGETNVTLTDKPQTVKVEYVEKPSTSTPTFTVGTQNPQTGNVEVTVDGVPEGTKVKLPGISSEKVVTGGKVELTNSELPENPTTGKGIAQEEGKLPKEGTSDITIPGKLTSAKGEPAREFEVTIPLPIVVPDPEHLTPKEIEKLVDKVKESNPNTIVTADDKGNVTVTDKTTGESVLIPVKDLTVKDFDPVKPTEKVPVKDKSHLTPEEKKQVADKVKAKNPGKEVTVGDDGTATVTDPTTGISHTIPGTDLVNQDFDPVKPSEKVPVKDKSHLTPEEQKQVADKVKAKNPGKEVTVGDDGTATVKDPTTGISHTIPGTELVNQDFELVKPTDKVPVKDKSDLTPEEKKQVADKVKDKNPGKEVTVGDDGTATVTDPTTGISHTIPGTDLVNQDFEPVIPADKIPVKDPDNLTQEEQDKVKESVEKANPGKKVTVDKTGKVTITDPNTNISHEIPGEKLITLDPPVFELPEYTAPIGTTGVDENGNLIAPPIMAQTKLIITKWTDEDGKELKAPDAKAPKVLGEANEALEAGKIEGYEFVRTETKDDVVTHIFRKVTSTKPTKPADNGEEQGGDNKPQPTPTAKVETSTKRLANTGEAETNTGLAGLGLAILGSLLVVAKRRKKDEE